MATHRHILPLIATMGLACLVSCSSPEGGGAAAPEVAGGVYEKRIVEAPNAEPGSWLTPGLTYAEDRFSRLKGIDTENIGQLGLAWSYDLPVDRGQEATPLMIDGVLYFSTAWSMVVALDAKTGAHLWTYDPEVPKETGFKACCDVVNRGVAAWGDKIFVGTLDGRLIAIDRKSGKPVWSVVTVDQSKPYTITGAPRVVNGKVIIGNGGAEYGVRGYITAYDAETGKEAWRFFTVPGDPAKGFEAPHLEKAAKTWTGKWWENGGGGTVWDSMSFDPELNLLYIGVGNGSPWRRDLRSPGGGDNLYLSSIVAIDADTGKYVWHYQTTPGDDWDFTATAQMILAELTIDGQPRKVLMQAPKNGFFYVLDRKTGKLISAKNFVPQTWTTGVDMATGRPIEAAGARYKPGQPFVMQPSAFAAHNWHPMSFSHATGLVYIPVMDIPVKYVVDENYKQRKGSWNLGVDFSAAGIPDDFDERKKLKPQLQGRLIAWDPVRQREMWRVEHANPANGGVLSTAGNLVFQGTADGRFVAYDATTGKKLWEFATQMGIVAPPITYTIEGKQYVSVLVGWGAGYALASAFNDKSVGARSAPRRLLTFALEGKEKLPQAVTETLQRVPLPSAAGWTPEQLAAGRKSYYVNCGFCHGEAAVGNHVLPDLRYSATITDPNVFRQIVIDGMLKDNGMASFRAYLSPQDAENIRGYISSEARRFWAYEDARRTK